MKHAVIVSLMILMVSLTVKAQSNRVVGFWLTEKKTSQVEIYRTSTGTYEGKLVWLDEPLEANGQPKTDKENPEASMRRRPLIGTVLLKGFTYDASSKEWSGGTIYDPENGKTYDAYMWFDDSGVLNIKGFVMGMRFMGRSTTWTKESRKRE